MNWSWLAIATPSMIGGWLLGRAAARHSVLGHQRSRDATVVLVVLALGLFIAAFLSVKPLLSNVVAMSLLSAAAGLRSEADQTQSASGS